MYFAKVKKLSVNTCQMIEDWKESFDQNNIISALFVDLSKAFDSLLQCLLMAKFRSHVLSLPACDLLSS